MKEDFTNPKLFCFRTGARVPNVAVPVPEGTHLGFDGLFTLVCAVNQPTVEEKQTFKSGTPCQFGLVVEDGVIFFLSRFGTLNWMDAPFNIHLYPDNRARLLEVPGPTQGYGLHVMLVDSSTGF